MDTQSKGSYASRHRITLAITAVSALSLTAIAPHLAVFDTQSASVTAKGQPAAGRDQASTTTSDASRQEQQTMQQTSSDNSSQTTITVNGQQIPVPANGSYSSTTDDESGHTEINVESSQSGNSSVQLTMRSESSSSSSD